MRVPNAEVVGRRKSLERRAKTDGRRRRGGRAFGEAQGGKNSVRSEKGKTGEYLYAGRKKIRIPRYVPKAASRRTRSFGCVINDAQGRGGRLEAGRGEAMVEAKTGRGGDGGNRQQIDTYIQIHTKHAWRKARPAYSGEKIEVGEVTEYVLRVLENTTRRGMDMGRRRRGDWGGGGHCGRGTSYFRRGRERYRKGAIFESIRQ